MKKKAKIITRYVHERLFDADICLVLSDWQDFIEGATKFMPKEKLPELKEKWERHGHQPHTKAVQFPMPGGGSIIWVRIEPEEPIGTLVHEITHAAHHLLDCRDTPHSKETEEIYAYLVEFLFNGLVKPPA